MLEKFKFTDREGTEWDLEITMETHYRLRKYQFDRELFPETVSLASPSAQFVESLTNAEVLFQVIYAILKPQIDEKLKNVPSSQRETAFFRRISGQARQDAENAFVEAYSFFCPTLKVREYLENRQNMLLKTLSQMDEKQAQMHERLIQTLDESLNGIYEQGQENIRQEVEAVKAKMKLSQE